jgi:hypothetical protein
MMTDDMVNIQIGSTTNNNAAAIQLLEAGETALIYNSSETQTIWIGNNPALTSGYQNAIPIQALGYLVVTAEKSPVYGTCSPGVAVMVSVIPGGVSFFTPLMDATITGPVTITGTVEATIVGTPNVNIEGDVTFSNDEINVTGIGGYISPGEYTLLENDTSGHSITGLPNSYTTSIFNVTTYQSFSLSVSAYCESQATTNAELVAQMTLNYYADSAGTILLDQENCWFWLGNALNTLAPIHASGPTKGAYMSITIDIAIGGETCYVSQIALYGTGQSLPKTVFKQSVPTSMNSGLTLFPSINPVPPTGVDGLLADETDNQDMSVSTTYWWPLPLFAGTVYMRFATGIALANDFVVCSARGLLNGNPQAGSASTGCLWNPGNAAGTDYTISIEVGNCPLYFVVKTTSSAGPVITFHAEGVPA